MAIVLAAGLLLGMAAWQAVTPWLGIAVAVAAVVAACVIYRVDPRGRAGDASDEDDDQAERDEREPLSTRRRAAGRP